MTNPEIEKQRVPEAITQVQERFSPEVERQLQELGAQVQTQSPQNLTDDQGQIVVQSTDPNDLPDSQLEIPVPKDTAEIWSKGNINDSQTWLGVQIIRKVKLALRHGWKIIVGGS